MLSSLLFHDRRSHNFLLSICQSLSTRNDAMNTQASGSALTMWSWVYVCQVNALALLCCTPRQRESSRKYNDGQLHTVKISSLPGHEPRPPDQRASTLTTTPPALCQCDILFTYIEEALPTLVICHAFPMQMMFSYPSHEIKQHRVNPVNDQIVTKTSQISCDATFVTN